MSNKTIVKEWLECDNVNCQHKDEQTYYGAFNGNPYTMEVKSIDKQFEYHKDNINISQHIKGDYHICISGKYEDCLTKYENSLISNAKRQYENAPSGKYCYFDNKPILNKDLPLAEIHENNLWCKSCIIAYSRTEGFNWNMKLEDYINTHNNISKQKRKEAYHDVYNALSNPEFVKDIFEFDSVKNAILKIVNEGVKK